MGCSRYPITRRTLKYQEGYLSLGEVNGNTTEEMEIEEPRKGKRRS